MYIITRFRALMAEKRLSEALALAESNGKLAHDTAIELRQVREQRDALAKELAEAVRERDNAISDWKQADTDSIRAIHERNQARDQLDALANALKKTASDFIAFRNIARENGIVGTLGLESLELAANALAAVERSNQ